MHRIACDWRIMSNIGWLGCITNAQECTGMHRGAWECTGTHNNACECTGKMNNFQQCPSKMTNKRTNDSLGLLLLILYSLYWWCDGYFLTKNSTPKCITLNYRPPHPSIGKNWPGMKLRKMHMIFWSILKVLNIIPFKLLYHECTTLWRFKGSKDAQIFK